MECIIRLQVRAEALHKPKQAKASNSIVGAGEKGMEEVFNNSMTVLAESLSLLFCSDYSGHPVLSRQYSVQEFEKEGR